MPSLADVDTVIQGLPQQGGGAQPSGAPQYGSYPMVQPHPTGEAPAGAGLPAPQTNLSPEDYAKLMAGKQAPAAPAQAPADVAMPAPTYSSPDLAAKMDIAKQASAGPLPMPTSTEFPTAGKQTGYLANLGAGTSEAVAQTLGLPVDLTTALINAGAKAVGLPQISEPVGGAGTFEKLFGLIGANPENVAPADQGERLARAAARGAAGVALPGGIASRLVRAGMTAPALASVAQGAGVGGAAAGGAGGVGGEIAREVAPEPLKPLAEMVGNIATAAPVAFGTAAATAGTRAATEAVQRALTPSARIPEIVGKTVTEAAGGPVPTTPAPIPSVQLNVPEVTQSPSAASAMDVLNAQNVPAMKAEQAAKNAQMRSALMGTTEGEPGLYTGPDVTPKKMARTGSARAVGGVQQAQKIVASEERRLWNTPAMSRPIVSTRGIEESVDQELRTIARDDPMLFADYNRSAELKAVVEDMHTLLPAKAAAKDINGMVRSKFLSIARNPKEAGEVKIIARRLAQAAENGLWNAPEVVGRAPATQAELEAAGAVKRPELHKTEVIEGTWPNGQPYRVEVNPSQPMLLRMLKGSEGPSVRVAVRGADIAVSDAMKTIHRDVAQALRNVAHPMADSKEPWSNFLMVRALSPSSGRTTRVGDLSLQVTDNHGNYLPPADWPVGLRRAMGAEERAPTPPTWAGGAPIAERAPRKPETFLDAVIRKGGVKPSPEYEAMDAGLYHHRQGGRLVNKNGMNSNQLREFAAEEGFTRPDEMDDRVAEDMIRDGLNGIHHYRPADEAAADYHRQLQQHAAQETYQRDANMTAVRDAAEAEGVKLSPAEQEHAAEMMLQDPEMHAAEAVRQASFAGEEAALQANAQRLAFGAPGVEPSARTSLMPDLQQLREGVKPDPELARDLKAARAFTKREAETLGHASFDNILRRNTYGNETVVPGTAMSNFIDFNNGVAKPGDIKNLSKFLGEIKSNWLKLNAAERDRTYDPETIGPVRQELEEGFRNFITGRLLAGMVAKKGDFDWRKAATFLGENRDMLKATGVFTKDQLDLVDRWVATADMIASAKELGRAEGSPTFTRAVHPMRFVDLFTGPLTGRILGGAAGAVLGNLLTNWLGEAAIGAMIGAEMGGAGRGAGLMQVLYQKPREELLRSLDEAFRNPPIAHDLAMGVRTAGKTRPSAATQAWVRSLLSTQPAQAVAGLAQQPQPSVPEHADGGLVSGGDFAPFPALAPVTQSDAYGWGWRPGAWKGPNAAAQQAYQQRRDRNWVTRTYPDGTREGVTDTGVHFRISPTGVVTSNLQQIPDPQGGRPAVVPNSLYNPYNDPAAFDSVTGEPLFGWTSRGSRLNMADYYAGKLQPVQLRMTEQQYPGDTVGKEIQFAPSNLPYVGWSIPGNTAALNGETLEQRLAEGRAMAAAHPVAGPYAGTAGGSGGGGGGYYISSDGFWTGGEVGDVMGPKPPNRDDGYISAQRGEFVLKRDAVARYGLPVINALNAGQIDPGVLARAMRPTTKRTGVRK